MTPAYLKLYEKSKLKERIEIALNMLSDCNICPRECHINRLDKEKGQCQTAKKAVISSYGPHFGEESILVGTRGSGTIFFAFCNLKCIFCQNFDISQSGQGYEVDDQDIANMMLELQNLGCHNINFVSPTHVVPQILSALYIAIENGLKLPLVYNTGGYDSLETLKLLDGIVDIYMPDMKYGDPEIALDYSKIKDYPRINMNAVKEMHRQVGDMILDESEIAVRGLLVRHLVLPNNLAGTEEILKFLANDISKNTYLNVMDQYRPCHKARFIPELNRSITSQEYKNAVELAMSYGLTRLDSKRFWRWLLL